MKIVALLFGLLLFAWGSAVTASARRPPVDAVMDDALASFQNNDYDKALQELQKANQLAPNNPFILNMLGAALTKKKEYDQASVDFKQALSIDASFFPAKFNLGEILFLQKQYPQALDYFNTMLSDTPGNGLLTFKIVLCLLQTDRLDEAKQAAATLPPLGDGPDWYFAQAAIAIKQKDGPKAAKYIAAAQAYYGDKTAIYLETFSDLNWPTK